MVTFTRSLLNWLLASSVDPVIDSVDSAGQDLTWAAFILDFPIISRFILDFFLFQLLFIASMLLWFCSNNSSCPNQY